MFHVSCRQNSLLKRYCHISEMWLALMPLCQPLQLLKRLFQQCAVSENAELLYRLAYFVSEAFGLHELPLCNKLSLSQEIGSCTDKLCAFVMLLHQCHNDLTTCCIDCL